MSYTSLYFHIIFATKNRKTFLTEQIRPKLFGYISGVAANLDSKILLSNGIEDHIHILASLSSNKSIAEFIRTIKANSSKWIHQEFEGLSYFGWQDGYSAFTVSYSGVGSVIEYIKNQQAHHTKIDYVDELKMFYEKHKIQYNPQYIQ